MKITNTSTHPIQGPGEGSAAGWITVLPRRVIRMKLDRLF